MANSTGPMAVQELVDYCIDFLFASPPDLKTCALVSRSWTPAAQRHLFSHIIIGSSGYSYGQTTFLTLTRRRCARLFEISSASSRLIGYIESLQINLDTVPSDVLETVSRFPFVRLRQVTVSGNWVARTAIGVVRDLLSVPTLTELSISGNFGSLPEFVEVLECCSPNIRDLAFCSVRIAPFNVFPDPHPSERSIAIDTLDLWWSDGIHEWLNSPQCPFDFSNLKRLRLNENTSLPQWKAFSPAIPGVEHLQFQAQIRGPAPLDLAPFTCLKSLEIFVEYNDDVTSALETLSTMAPANQLQTLRLCLSHSGIPDAELGEQMDAYITELSLPCLKVVELVYRSLPLALSRVAEKLPLLNARQLVRVSSGD